jgi:hypothetical protein
MRTEIPPRRSATQSQLLARRQNPIEAIETEEYPDIPRSRSSAIRYVDRQGNQVIQRGQQRFVIHDEPPPRRTHWMTIFGVGMAFMVVLFICWTLAVNWWTAHQLDATYGFPRTYQTDAVVYSGDSADHPSHYIFMNLNGSVLIIELPHGDSAHARIYKGPTIFSDNAPSIPVTGEFKVVNSKEEMLIHIQGQVIVYVNDGTQFKPQ